MTSRHGQSDKIGNRFCWVPGDLNLVENEEIADCTPSVFDIPRPTQRDIEQLLLTEAKGKADPQRSAEEGSVEARQRQKPDDGGEQT